MPAPAILEPIIQKASNDCGIACLAMLLGKPYATVSAAALSAIKRPHQNGLSTREIVALARTLGARLAKAHHGVDLADETGLLLVEYPDGDLHFCVLFEGIVVNPADGLLYVPDVYVSSRKARVTGLWRVV